MMKQIVEMYYNDFCQQPDCALSDELSQELVKNGDTNAY